MKLAKKKQSRDVDKFFGNMFGKSFEDFFQSRFPNLENLRRINLIFPSIDMFEKDNQIVVKVELPGIDKENVNISVSDGLLNIKGEVKKEKEVKDEDYYYSERSIGSFARSISLPSKVKEDKIEAKYDDGILEITLPKAPETKVKDVKVKVK